jgi:uncharacterized repeat protein (TIGR01451 family)
MRIRGFLLTALVVALAVPAAASADTTLGTTTQPSSSTAHACPTSPANQLLITTSGPLTGPLSVPSSATPMAVTQWQVNATGAPTGTQLTLVVIRINVSAATITVVGVDNETVNTATLSPDGIETFTPQTAIPVEPNDIIGLYLPGSTTGLTCYWSGGSSPADAVQGLALPTPPVAGAMINPSGLGSGISSPNSTLNLAATVAPLIYDAGVSLSAGPSDAVVGQPAVLTATLTNHGPLAGPITFTDVVPNGLTIQAASIGSGTCTTNTGLGLVTCTSNGLAVGQSGTVVIVVTPTAAQTYTDRGGVSLPDGATDPNPANNNASTTLRVTKAGAPTKCAVPKLGGASVAVAKRVLPLLGCKVGKTHKVHSKSVAKGLLVGTSPGAGSYPLGKVIALKVSSGKG